jgi:SAM-dependent methyltransferase
MTNNHGQQAKACCADLYHSDLARMLLGDSLHPGGLRLTNRLGRLLGLNRGAWVADLASGQGASASAIARSFHCRVIGIEYRREALVRARQMALDAPVSADIWFVQGDAEMPPLKPESLDAVFAECSLSVFPNKQLAVDQATRLLKPGGRLGITDVTVEPGFLPQELDNPLGQMLCVTGALGVEGYARLLSDAGLSKIYREDASEHVGELLARIKATLTAFTAFSGLLNGFQEEGIFGELPPTTDWDGLLDKLEKMLSDGLLGYWVYVGEKPR